MFLVHFLAHPLGLLSEGGFGSLGAGSLVACGGVGVFVALASQHVFGLLFCVIFYEDFGAPEFVELTVSFF